MKVMELRCAVLVVLLGLVVTGKAEIYIVTVEGEPIISYKGGENGFEATAVESDEKLDTTSELVTSYASHLEKKHDMLLGMLFERGSYKKLYSYKHLINGFSVHLSPEQAETLRRAPGVKSVERDWKVRRLTTHTPQFLGLPTGVWPTGGGFDRAGEDIVIGFVDSGIYPLHPSFAAYHTDPYGPVPKYRGKCEIDPDTKRDFCNGKIIGAQHFAEAAKAAGAFNPAIDFASPMDGDGHGSHTAAIAAGNNGIPVRVHGHEFGKASGMAPRARIAVYKALYRLFGGFVADVVAAIDQAVHDGVDILSLSVGPNSPQATTKTTFLNPFDATLLAAVKAGVFVAQAAGNGGPFPKTLVSYSPWIASVAAAIDDRRYKNHLNLGNGKILAGMGLSPSTHPNQTYTIGSIGDGLMPILHKSAPQVALFSARGPNIKDYSFQDADLLKPDILAPGSLIWAAWSPNGTDEPNYVGEGFAMISGTSMAAPHIAGIAALLKQKHPHWSPAAIKSALMTTSTKLDRAGRPLQAQQYSETEAMKLVTATPFDYGSGHVNPRAALDPGLIFHAARMHPSIAIETNPSAMTLKPGASRKFSVTLTARSVTGTYSFGEITMKGSRGHKVSIPVVAMGYWR
ncbi:PA-domain containing subtilase family protein isoform 3 [Theobroma cacao]|uniref:PA-domain containing subtilase family protein isoform 3 n=1 Tax=Theobroma cacao TaxID=3641 RepID=A0A061GS64_THECC|nr:PA-domain containing subtilase family protein isoform 3 [Theobroma cacao]